MNPFVDNSLSGFARSSYPTPSHYRNQVQRFVSSGPHLSRNAKILTPAQRKQALLLAKQPSEARSVAKWLSVYESMRQFDNELKSILRVARKTTTQARIKELKSL